MVVKRTAEKMKTEKREIDLNRLERFSQNHIIIFTNDFSGVVNMAA